MTSTDPSSTDALGLPEKLLRIEAGFRGARIPHAFGGALALAYYATPRATIDIDVNVFVGADRASEVLDCLTRLGVAPPDDGLRASLARDGQVRLRWGKTPVDLFLAYDPFHDACLTRRRAVPFGAGETIHVLAAEDLVVFKAVFDREKDWRDIEEIVFTLGPALPGARILDWLERIVGIEDARFTRCRDAIERQGTPA